MTSQPTSQNATAQPAPQLVREDAVNSENIAYLNDLYTGWRHDPASVDSDFAMLFGTLGEAQREEHPDLSLSPSDASSGSSGYKECSPRTQATQRALLEERLKNAFRLCGHLCASLDPLNLRPVPELPELSLDSFLHLAPAGSVPALRELHARMRDYYCGPIGAEFMHLQNAEQRNWWMQHLETDPAPLPLSQEHILALITRAEGFEIFCQQRFAGMRRFGLEGGESLIIALQALIHEAAHDRVDSISLGMPHRGRLNVMANILHKPFEAIFSEFSGHMLQPEGVSEELRISGDVKYHLGTTTTLKQGRNSLLITLLPNPSHLEAVDPVVLGRVRADQDRRKDIKRQQHLGILVHGDAAFAGQGVVYETLQLSRLRGYQTGGTIHLIINNQIGFTTSVEDAHSGLWNSDIAKTVQAPVLHVNGDDPEAVARCAALAHAWRRDFASDIVIDILCYRRHGHNETDDPAFTQPAMVRAIAAHAPLREHYGRDLIEKNIFYPAEVNAIWDSFQHHLQQAYDAAKHYRPDGTDWLDHSPLDPTRLKDEPERIQPMTGIPLARLHELGEAITTTPPEFSLHPRLARQLEARRRIILEDGAIDWATAEALAFGSLALDGHMVRLSGQDCGRGTFSQRHAVLTDQETGKNFTPLAQLAPRQAPVEVWNSPLSEYAVLGFEYGYSLGNPEALVLWEAQFGDFANGAQIIIDQFLAAGETKWLRSSGLTLLLPHGYEGAGPEHSSARPERFLQLCAENNLRVCMPSSPASFFHLLRRQIARRCRKPLIVFSPKSLLRHKQAVSPLAEIGPQTRFRPVLDDPALQEDRQNIRRIILCAGKIYYDLLARRDMLTEDRGKAEIALIRLEQLYPFPHHALVNILGHYPKATDMIWCQEEPHNAGAWHFIDRRIEQALKAARHKVKRARYTGRKPSASPATGSLQLHRQEQEALVEAALFLSENNSETF